MVGGVGGWVLCKRRAGVTTVSHVGILFFLRSHIRSPVRLLFLTLTTVISG